MTKRFHLIPLVTIALASAACSDRAPSSPPSILPPPPVNSGVIGTIYGKVDGETMTATYVPTGGTAGSYGGAISPATYGSPATVSVSGKFDSIHTTAGGGGTKTWFFHVKLQNLLTYPIGANYGQAAPPDTSGVFIFFPANPVVTLPVGCACAVTVFNPMGSGNFTATGQKYFWYQSRPNALGSLPAGSDTTTNTPQWRFRATPSSGANVVQAFTFQLEVSAAWPSPIESTWRTTYLATNDTFPDSLAKPLWRKFKAPATQTIGVETYAIPTLRLSNTNATHSIYFSRNDSLGNNSAEMDVTVQAMSGGASLQAVFGFAEPGGKQVFAGIFGNGISLVTFDSVAGAWATIGATFCSSGGPCRSTTSRARNYRLKKIGTTTVELCENSLVRATLAYGSLQATNPSFASRTAVFGMPGLAAAANPSRWTSVAYTIGSDGGACP